MRPNWQLVWCAAVGMGLLCAVRAPAVAADDARALEIPPQSQAHEISPGGLDPAAQTEPDGSSYASESAVFEQLVQDGVFDQDDARRVCDDIDTLISRAEKSPEEAAALSEALFSSRDTLIQLDTHLLQYLAEHPLGPAEAEQLTDSEQTTLAQLRAALAAQQQTAEQQAGALPADASAEGGTPAGGYRYWRDEIGGLLSRVDSCLIGLGLDDDRRFSKYDPLRNELHNTVFPVASNSDFVSRYIGKENEARHLFDPPKGTPRRRSWDFKGDIGFHSGQGNFSQEEGQEWHLEEKLKLKSNKELGFYQRYDLDHSYSASSTLSIGAEQSLPKLWWDGKLRLKEEFRLFDDKNNTLNNRQDGLFQADFNPQWQDGAWKADLSYKYNIKEYETFSPRSYRQNRAKVKLGHDFSDDLNGSVYGSVDDYTYSFGSNRGNTKTEVGTEWEWQLNDKVKLNASLEHEEKTYDVRKSRSYEQDQWDVSARWTPDADTDVNVRSSFTDYSAAFSPDRDYENHDLSVSAQHTFSPRWQGSVNASSQSKKFDVSPDSDLDQKGYGGSLSYTPDRDWNFYANLNHNSYDYTDPLRAFDSDNLGLGASYSRDAFNFGASWNRADSSYAGDSARDYSNTSLSLNAGYDWERHKLSAYWTQAQLDQADPLSTSDYTENSMGASWQFKLSQEWDLNLSFDHNTRDYSGTDSLKDDRFEARLEFDL